MDKKLLQVAIISALLGGVFGSLISAETSRAGIFDNILDFFKPVEVEKQEAEVAIPPYEPVLEYEEAIIGAVEEADPSVVSVVITKDLPVITRCSRDPFDGLLPPELRRFFGDDFDFSVPCESGTERREVGGGSGFIISEDGLILTNKHVVSDESAEYSVLTNDGEEYEAEVLARDPVQDIAVIKIGAEGLKPAKLGDSDSVKLGQTAIAIGNSLGELRNTVSVGVVSGLARTITASGRGSTETIQGLIQTDAAINPGNSGGPLLNLKGEVIGINVAVASGAQNIGFAIPINFAKRDIQSVKETGEIKIPFLGVRYITEEDGARLRGSDDGPAVMPDSPAEAAGLQAEDIVLEINGNKVSPDTPLGFLIQRYNVGEVVVLKVQRGEEIIELNATLEERPSDN